MSGPYEDQKKMLDARNRITEFGKNLSGIHSTLLASGIYNRSEIQWYEKFNRLGIKDPYNAPTGSKEYLFFTKPDLHLVTPKTTNIINPELANQPYFVELLQRYPKVISQLQSSCGNGSNFKNPFMNILSNSVQNTLDLPAIESDVVDTSETIYGTAYNYRGWGYKSDENLTFSLEFEDTKYLEIYNLVKAYEEYERLKHMGMVTPPNIEGITPNADGVCMSYYIRNKILHDQFSIYKFIVDDDGETIIYYAKLWGVFFKNVPRDTFSEMKVEGGLTYAVEFEAAFVDDMNPTILTDFNSLVRPYYEVTQDFPIYNKEKRMIDGRWATIPMVARIDTADNKVWNGPKDMKHIYKLKWRI